MHVDPKSVSKCKCVTNTSSSFDGTYSNHSVYVQIFVQKVRFNFRFAKMSVQWKKTNILIVVTIIQQRTKTSSSSPSFNKNNLCRRGQGVKRKLKDVVSYLESKSMCSCFQAVKSCSKSCGCENPFGKNEGQDLQLPIQ